VSPDYSLKSLWNLPNLWAVWQTLFYIVNMVNSKHDRGHANKLFSKHVPPKKTIESFSFCWLEKSLHKYWWNLLKVDVVRWVCKSFSKNTNAKTAASKNQLTFVSLAIFFWAKKILYNIIACGQKWRVSKADLNKFKHGIVIMWDGNIFLILFLAICKKL